MRYFSTRQQSWPVQSTVGGGTLDSLPMQVPFVVRMPAQVTISSASAGPASIEAMVMGSRPRDYQYAIAVRDGSDLWLVAVVRRSRNKGEFFVSVPRPKNPGWNPHVSYHRNGTFHSKRYDRIGLTSPCQPLNGKFRGTEHFGACNGARDPKRIGIVCNRQNYTDVLEIPLVTLGSHDGTIVVDLVEPGCNR
jgi:hypothetical protein